MVHTENNTPCPFTMTREDAEDLARCMDEDGEGESYKAIPAPGASEQGRYIVVCSEVGR